MAAALILIVAYSRNRAIGRANTLPWRLPGDLAHFKSTTLGKPIIMGRKTWESLGRPLPGRLNIVVSRDPSYAAAGAVVVQNLDAAVAACGDAPQAFIIGGAQIYATALPHADEIIATEVDAVIEADTFFPVISADWHEVERHAPVEENGYRYAFVTYRRQ